MYRGGKTEKTLRDENGENAEKKNTLSLPQPANHLHILLPCWPIERERYARSRQPTCVWMHLRLWKLISSPSVASNGFNPRCIAALTQVAYRTLPQEIQKILSVLALNLFHSTGDAPPARCTTCSLNHDVAFLQLVQQKNKGPSKTAIHPFHPGRRPSINPGVYFRGRGAERIRFDFLPHHHAVI